MSQGGDTFDPNAHASADAGPPKRGMSTGVKVLLIVGGVVGVMALLCAGGVFYLVTVIKGSMTRDPAKVVAIQEEIVEIDVPDGFQPQGGFNFGIGPVKMKVAAYARGGGEVLMVMEVPGDTSDADAQQKVQEAMEKQGQNQDLNVESQETRKIIIDGQEVSFQFTKGTHGESGAVMRQVLGVFPGRDGTVVVMYMAPDENWDEEEVMTMLRSIKVEK